jgi:hypothetical protein
MVNNIYVFLNMGKRTGKPYYFIVHTNLGREDSLFCSISVEMKKGNISETQQVLTCFLTLLRSGRIFWDRGEVVRMNIRE